MAGYVKYRKKIPITMKRSPSGSIPKLGHVDIPFPLLGIHLERARDQVPAGSAIDTDGIRLRYGALERAYGWSALGGVLDDDVVGLGVYITDAGNIEIIALSTDTFYKYNSGWTSIPKNPAGSLTGNEYDLFWMAQLGSDLLFCQGIDSVMKFSGGSDFAVLSANCPPAKSGVGHQGRLLLGHTFEGGNEYPHRVRWNVIDTITDWTGAGSGFIDLDDTSDYLTCVTVLGNFPIVFKEHTIIIASRTGLISPVYEFAARDSINGTYAARSVVNLGDRVAYVGKNDIFVFDLNKSISIGDPVKSRFFDEMNPTYKHQCVAYLDEALDEVHFCIPTGNNTYNDSDWIWNRKDNVWYLRKREVKSVGTFFSASAPTWDSLSATSWDVYLRRWKSGSLDIKDQSIIFGSRTGQIYKEDPSVRSAAGVAFESFYETGDMQVDPSKYSGISYVEVRYRDVGIECLLTIGLSNDGGNSWTGKTETLETGTGSGKILHKYFFQTIQGRNLSLRVYTNSTSAHFEIVGIRLWMTTVGK